MRGMGGRGGIGRVKDPFGCDEPAFLACSGTTDRVAARRFIASRAADASELALLLDMLGLLPENDPHPARRDRGAGLMPRSP